MSKAKKQKNGNKHRALSAQQTIPYIAMHPDGICQIPGGLYTKTLEYEDINYAVASTEDQTAIISGWSACLNYFDSSLPFQLSFVNRRSRSSSRYKVNIPPQEDDYNSIREEYVEMLKGQIAKSNNGIERYKYITFGLPAEGVAEARPRLGRVEADVMGNLKRLGVQSRPLDGRDRLAVLHGQMHPGGREPFRFAWKDIPKTGMGTKDYIAPDSFDFRQSRTFRVGQMWGAASYLQIMASELSDKLLAEILELDAELTVTMHIQTVDQLKAIKTIKGKISDIGRMKAEEQKKAVRAGYDMEILPPDLITFSKDAAELLSDLQSRNERMFLLTFTVVNLAPTRQRLENDVFTVSGIAQKYNCALRRLDWQQEQGFVSSLALGYNGIEIQRGMTTSSTAIFIPFMTRELRMDGQALYYGMNALSNNVIMADRKKLKSANGMYLGSTGSGKSFAAKRELINVFLATNDSIIVVDPMGEYAPLVRRLGGQVIEIAPDSPHHISPMDLQMNINDEDSPLSMKADFLLSLCELIVGGKEGLQPIEKTVIDRCVRLVYREMALGLETAKTPLLQDEWGHYGSDRAALEQDFAARVQEYQRLYNVGVKQTEAPGLYKYYSTQRPVDIGTFPKSPRNAPDEIVNYDQRVPVENGSFLAWGHLTYTRPLTNRQASDYELRPAPDNPDRPRSIREQMKTAAKQAEADRGQSVQKKNTPDRGDR